MSELLSTNIRRGLAVAAAVLAVNIGGSSGESGHYGERVPGLPVPDLLMPAFPPFLSGGIASAEAASSRRFKVMGVVLGVAGGGSLNIDQDPGGVEAQGHTKTVLSRDYKTEYHDNYKICEGIHRRDRIIGTVLTSSGKEIKFSRKNIPQGARVIVKGRLIRSASLCFPIPIYENDRPVFGTLMLLGNRR